MHTKTRWIAIGTLAVAVIGTGAGIAVAGGSGDTSVPISGSALDKATAVALDHTGGGTVTGTEIGDEEGYYEVEVRRDDGSVVDVHLDEDFQVLNTKADGANEDEGNEADR